ncbi:MAG TPA: RNA methyltransferase [Bacteroidia bacterium]|jgi:TrmH family RNA methyltransferase|nr:RNA methyltransferase [Bacteroidia bacterium]
MLSQAQIKLIKSLQLRKHRREAGLFIAEGIKVVEELVTSAIKVEHVYASDKYEGLVPHIKITDRELNQVSSLTNSQGIIALCRIPSTTAAKPDLKKEFVIALDNIRDPGNMGTIIRIADWFGIKHIFCSNESVDAYNSKVVQATMGSIARVNVHYIDLPAMLADCTKDNTPVYGALLSGKNVYTEKLTSNGVLVIGNEANGISEQIEKLIGHPISIPSYANGKGAESLNAAIATAILCAEFRRR